MIADVSSTEDEDACWSDVFPIESIVEDKDEDGSSTKDEIGCTVEKKGIRREDKTVDSDGLFVDLDTSSLIFVGLMTSTRLGDSVD